VGMPCWFRFSAVTEPLAQMFGRTAALRESYGFRPRDMARLSLDEETGQFELQEESIQTIRKDGEALDIASEWEGFAVAYNVLEIRATVYLHFWKQDSGACLALEIDDQVPYVKLEGLAEGEWLERLAVEYTAACGASACAHGRDWYAEFIPLEPEQLILELRSGKLLKRPLPGFYMIAQSLLGNEEMASLLLEKERDSRLRYFRTSTGYHVLSSLCRRSWG
jgi:hypothetical protein